MLVEQREAGRDTDRRITALVLAQQASRRRWDEIRAAIQAYLESLRKPGGNGQQAQ